VENLVIFCVRVAPMGMPSIRTFVISSRVGRLVINVERIIKG
jgi:hypothetical protein